MVPDHDPYARRPRPDAADCAATPATALELDLPAYIANLRQSDDRDCHYLISEIAEVSKRLQRELGLKRYLSPILAGTGMGSALAALVPLGGFGRPFVLRRELPPDERPVNSYSPSLPRARCGPRFLL
jgi:type IV secretory pathway VirJ component